VAVMGTSTSLSPSESQFAHPRGLLGWVAGQIMAIENRRRNELAVSVLDPQPDDHVLEIGFGPGVTVQRLSSLVANGSVAGVDSSQVMVDLARRRNAKAIRKGRVDLRYSSVELLPFPDGPFDRALAVNSQHHWPHPVSNLREVRRVLKPGGVIVIAEQPVWEKGDADDFAFASNLAERLTASGFEQVEIITRRMCPAPTICVRGIKPAASEVVRGTLSNV
jgi:ubiquinone/menaquinone biosynthesis C-methylase UbiE